MAAHALRREEGMCAMGEVSGETTIRGARREQGLGSRWCSPTTIERDKERATRARARVETGSVETHQGSNGNASHRFRGARRVSVRAGRCAVLAPGDEPMRAPGPKRVRSDVGARRFLRRSVENGSGPLPLAHTARAPRRHPNMAAAFIARGFAITASLAGARTSARRAPTSSARGVVFHANRRRVPVASAGRARASRLRRLRRRRSHRRARREEDRRE